MTERQETSNSTIGGSVLVRRNAPTPHLRCPRRSNELRHHSNTTVF